MAVDVRACVRAVVVVSVKGEVVWGGEIRSSPYPLSASYRSLAVTSCVRVRVVIRSVRVAVEKVVVVKLTKGHGWPHGQVVTSMPGRLSMMNCIIFICPLARCYTTLDGDHS